MSNGTSSERTALREITGGVAWYYDDPDDERPTKHEGDIEVHRGWIRLASPILGGVWIPRENVQRVHES